MHPVLILLVGMATILAGIVLLRLNAFLALLIAAIVVSLLAPGEPAVKIARVAEGFGRTAGTVGIVIALAAITGQAMLGSGAADRIVNGFLALLGEKRGATALCATGYVLSIPVFFDTVFYLLLPLARSMYGRTNRNYLKYLLAIAAGAGATHTLVPPTPGPLAIAGTLGVDLGTMVLVGAVVALPAATAGLWFAGWLDRRMPVLTPFPSLPSAALRAGSSGEGEGEGEGGLGPGTHSLPGLIPSLLPIVLPVLLISSNTVVVSMTSRAAGYATVWSALAPYSAILGNPNLALLVGTAVAMWVYARHRGASRADLAAMVETSLMSAGVMILIIAASGGFGVALQATEIGSVIEHAFVGQAAASGIGSGLVFLFLGFGVASLIKLAQGSSTVAMITSAAMLAAMLPASGLPFHTVYVATAIASGSLVGTWMNDSGFWLFSKMGGVTEIETLRSWTPVLALVGVTAMVTTLVLAVLVPLR
jgi:gluconate:H+ symporter, GntP family